jgi:hypothetical protein
MLALAPLLAVDVGGLIAIAFMVISFIGWLSNLVSGQQKPGQRPQQPQPRQRPPQSRKLREEIDAFLQEAQGKPRERPEPPRRPAEVLTAEQVEAPAGGRRSQPARKPKPRPERPAPRPAATPEQRRSPVPSAAPVAAAAAPSPPKRESWLERRELPPTISDSVSSHFHNVTQPVAGAMTEIAGERARSGAAAAELLKLLRDPAGVRQALVLQELLSPPLAMRRQRPAAR